MAESKSQCILGAVPLHTVEEYSQGTQLSLVRMQSCLVKGMLSGMKSLICQTLELARAKWEAGMSAGRCRERRQTENCVRWVASLACVLAIVEVGLVLVSQATVVDHHEHILWILVAWVASHKYWWVPVDMGLEFRQPE